MVSIKKVSNYVTCSSNNWVKSRWQPKLPMVLNGLKYLSQFWRTLEMPLINCEISLQLTCSKKCILAASTAANQVPKFKITGTKLYVTVVTLSTQENIKLLKQLESGFKRTIN